MVTSPYCFNESDKLFKGRICLMNISKNLKGKITHERDDSQVCARPACR